MPTELMSETTQEASAHQARSCGCAPLPTGRVRAMRSPALNTIGTDVIQGSSEPSPRIHDVTRTVPFFQS